MLYHFSFYPYKALLLQQIVTENREIHAVTPFNTYIQINVMKNQSDVIDDDDADAGDDEDDDGVDFLDHRHRLPQGNLNVDACVCLSSDACHCLSFRMDLPLAALVSSSCLSSLPFPSSRLRMMSHSLRSLLILNTVKEYVSCACSYLTSSSSSS